MLPPTHAHAPSRLNKKVAAIVQNGRAPTKGKKLQIENVKNKTRTRLVLVPTPPLHLNVTGFKWLRLKSQLTELKSNRDKIKLSFLKLVQFQGYLFRSNTLNTPPPRPRTDRIDRCCDLFFYGPGQIYSAGGRNTQLEGVKFQLHKLANHLRCWA